MYLYSAIYESIWPASTAHWQSCPICIEFCSACRLTVALNCRGCRSLSAGRLRYSLNAACAAHAYRPPRPEFSQAAAQKRWHQIDMVGPVLTCCKRLNIPAGARMSLRNVIDLGLYYPPKPESVVLTNLQPAFLLPLLANNCIEVLLGQ